MCFSLGRLFCLLRFNAGDLFFCKVINVQLLPNGVLNFAGDSMRLSFIVFLILFDLIDHQVKDIHVRCVEQLELMYLLLLDFDLGGVLTDTGDQLTDVVRAWNLSDVFNRFFNV